MNTKQTKKEYFSAHLPVWIIVACVAVALFGATAIVLSVWRLVSFEVRQPFDVVKDVVLLPIGLFCIATPLAIIFRSGYTVKNGILMQSFGFFRTKYEIKEISSLLLNSQEHKLTVYFEKNAVSILITPDKNEAFTRALIAQNPDIDYGFTLAENPPEEKKE